MTSAFQLAVWSAVVLAMAGALFGVAIARVLWAQDLVQANRLRDIWVQTEAALRQTEVALRSSIASQERQIAILKKRLGE